MGKHDNCPLAHKEHSPNEYPLEEVFLLLLSTICPLMDGWYGMVWYGMVWYGMVWYGMVWYGMVWYGMVWYGMVWYGMVWYGMVWYGMVWYGMVWYGMVWYGMVWYGMVWYGMVWYGMVWYGMVWYGMVWYGMVWYGMVWYGMVWYGMVWYGMVWYGMVWYGMVWYGMVWYGMVWYGMVWYVVVVVVVVKAPSTCRREKLPDTLSLGRAQGSSRPASRWPGVCRQRPRGGGAPWSGGRGGGGARGGGGGHLWKLPWSPPRWRRQPVKKERGCGGEEGPGAHAGRGGGAELWAGWRVRARGGGVAVCSAASATVRLTGEEGRPGLAKVGQGARGARGAGGHGQRRGPHPARRGRIPPSIIHGGESWWRRGEVPRRPLAAEPDRDGPRRIDTGGAGGAGLRGSRARVPGGCGPARGDQAGLWAAAGEGGRGRAGRARGRTPRGPQELGEGS